MKLRCFAYLFIFSFLLLQSVGVVGAAPSLATPICIGVNLELSGKNAYWGQEALKGIRLAIKEANQKGGLLGRSIEIALVDNGSDPAQVEKAAYELIEQKNAAVMIGAVSTHTTLAAVGAVTTKGIPLISPTASISRVTVSDTGAVRSWVFRGVHVDAAQGMLLSSFAMDKLKARSAALITEESSEYSNSIAVTFKNDFVAHGGQVLAESSYRRYDEDFTRQLNEVQKTQPEVILVSGYYVEVANFIRQARECGITVPIIGGDGWDSYKLFKIAGADAVKNCYFFTSYSAQEPSAENQRFVAAFAKEYAVNPTEMSSLAYDTVRLVLAAMQQAKSDEPGKVRDALEMVRIAGVLGTISFDKYHNPVKSGVIMSTEQGAANYFGTIQSREAR